MPEPVVSVVIPVRDGERFLGEAIASVLGQTRPPGEVLVVDDGSSDGSARVAAGFPGVSVLRRPPLGQAAASNAGVARASGDFLAFLDADDVWMGDKLERQLDAFRRDPALDLVFGHARQFLDPPSLALRLPERREILPAKLASAMLAKASSLRRVGPFDARHAIGAILEWYSRARALGLREEMLPGIVYLRRIHGANQTLRERDPAGYLSVVRHVLRARRAQEEAGP